MMELKTSSFYVYVLLLFISSLSISILAAPVTVDSSGGKFAVTSSPTAILYPKRASNSSFDSGSLAALASPPKDTDDLESPYSVDPAIEKLDQYASSLNLCDHGGGGGNVKVSRRDIYGQVPKICEFQYPLNGRLILKKDYEDIGQYGTLTSDRPIGLGYYGAVYDIIWMGQPAVAKWFKYKIEGLDEIYNLIYTQEIIYYGVAAGGLWAIMKKKNGVLLKDLPSYKVAYSEGVVPCTRIMHDLRGVIARANLPYLRMQGAPMHGDIHQENVLFESIEQDNGDIMIISRLIDWGEVFWNKMDHRSGDKLRLWPNDEDVKTYYNKLLSQLKIGWFIDGKHNTAGKHRFDSFSDSHTCLGAGRRARDY